MHYMFEDCTSHNILLITKFKGSDMKGRLWNITIVISYFQGKMRCMLPLFLRILVWLNWDNWWQASQSGETTCVWPDVNTRPNAMLSSSLIPDHDDRPIYAGGIGGVEYFCRSIFTYFPEIIVNLQWLKHILKSMNATYNLPLVDLPLWQYDGVLGVNIIWINDCMSIPNSTLERK